MEYKHKEKLEGVRRSNIRKQYYLEFDSGVINRLFEQLLQKKGWYLDYSAFKNYNQRISNNTIEKKNDKTIKKPINIKLRPLSIKQELFRFKNWMQNQRYAASTIRSYINSLDSFFRYFNFKKVCEIDEISLFNFISEQFIPNRISISFQNQIISAIKTYYLKTRQIKLEFECIERPRKVIALPKVIPLQVIKARLEQINNLKHKIALSTIYGLGLRRSALLNLRISDISFDRNLIHIKNAKGHKDRTLPLPCSAKKAYHGLL